MPRLMIYATAGMLFIGAAPLPYGYYTLLRFVVCFTCAFVAFMLFKKEQGALSYVFVGMALVFNPFFKVYLQKDVWVIIDIVAAILLLVSARDLKIDRK